MSDIGREFISLCEEDTERLGERLGRSLSDPLFIAIYGGLGAGKTAFVRGLAAGLGAAGVHSPTFSIVHEHEGRLRLLHFDIYRLSGADELYETGFADYLGEDAVIAMEWPEVAEEALPEKRLDVYISGGDADGAVSGDKRMIRMQSRCGAYNLDLLLSEG